MIISLFVLNYIKTKDAFKDNKYIILPVEKLCINTIKMLENCLKEKSSDKCQNENKATEHCYDESYNFSQICFIYISELEFV